MSWTDEPGYAMYTKDESREAVAQQFETRHGHAPAEVIDAQAVWLAGPIEEPGPDGAPPLLTGEQPPLFEGG